MGLVDLLRTTIYPNDTDPDDGTFGRSYRWTVTTGPYTPRTSNNGAGSQQGRYFNQGETTYGFYAVKPYSGLGNSRYMGRHFNFHDEPVSGYSWGDVSPAAMEVQRLDNPGHGPNGGPSEFTCEYTSGCSGAGTFNSTDIDLKYDAYNYVWFEIKWETTCTGYVKIWVVNADRPTSMGPVINQTGIITLNPNPSWFPGVQVWTGGYINIGYTSGGAAYIDHTLDFWGYSWAEAWGDTPVVVDEFGSDLSTATVIGSLDVDSFLIPDEIAAILGTTGGGGGGGAGGLFQDNFEASLALWNVEGGNATIAENVHNDRCQSVRFDVGVEGETLTRSVPEIGDLDRWYWDAVAFRIPAWEPFYTASAVPWVVGFEGTGDNQYTHLYALATSPSTGEIGWVDPTDDSFVAVASVAENTWVSLEFGLSVNSDNTIDRQAIVGGVDTGVVSESLATGAPTLASLGDGNASPDGLVFYLDTFTYQADTSPGAVASGPACATVPDCTPAGRFFRSPLWRFAVIDLDTFAVITLLDRLASQRVLTYTLNQPATAQGRVPSNNPEVNLPYTDTPQFPFVAEGVRGLIGLRLENCSYEPRFAGIIMQVEDAALSDDPYTSFTAYDPWMLLNLRPLLNVFGNLPGQQGFSFSNTRGSNIALAFAENTDANNGSTFIDFENGVIEDTQQLDIVFRQGTTVGQAWQQLVATGTMDIVLTPVYDPRNRPGILAELNIYAQAGSNRPGSIFAWNMPSHSLTQISRMINGTRRANYVQFFAGQGGPAVTPQTDATSIATYGEYWAQQFFPLQNVNAAVEALAAEQLLLRKDGQTTVTISPAPERSPEPFLDYYLGDRVPVYASNELREAITGYQRVYGIPVEIDDNGTEMVRQLLAGLPT